jgi:hypothetical protein
MKKLSSPWTLEGIEHGAKKEPNKGLMGRSKMLGSSATVFKSRGTA